MSKQNPYEDYDPIDPFDADASGDFSFVEDEYDSMEEGVGDGFTYVEPPTDVSTAQPGSTETFPATQVRRRYGDPVADPRVSEQGPVLRRHRHDRAERQEQESMLWQQPVPAPDRGPARPMRRRKKRGCGCLITLLVLIGIVVGAYVVICGPIDQRLAFTPAEQKTVDGTLSWSFPGMPYYVLALGSDAREGEEASRTDTMVLVRIDFFGGKVTMVSIPRDTKVQIEGYGTSKINAAYAYGGAGGAVRAVSKLTGTPINHVAVVHFEELVGLIDTLGGVTVNVPVAVNDPDYTGLVLDAGTQTMDGETALLWVRARHGFDDGDYQRQEDQRILITAIINRVLSLSPKELPAVLEQVGDLIGTDLRCYDLIPLLLRFKLASPTVYSCAIPTTSEMIDNLWFEIVDEAGTKRLMEVVNSGQDPSAV